MILGLTAVTQYSINFSRLKRTFFLSLHYDGSSSFLFVNTTKIYQLKAINSETKPLEVLIITVLLAELPKIEAINLMRNIGLTKTRGTL